MSEMVRFEKFTFRGSSVGLQRAFGKVYWLKLKKDVVNDVWRRSLMVDYIEALNYRSWIIIDLIKSAERSLESLIPESSLSHKLSKNILVSCFLTPAEQINLLYLEQFLIFKVKTFEIFALNIHEPELFRKSVNVLTLKRNSFMHAAIIVKVDIETPRDIPRLC